MSESLWLWVGFNMFVLAMLALDLGVFHRKTHVVSLKESLTWTGVWVVLALLFNAGVWHYAGSQKALEFFTGYVIEKSLSVDNVFIFAVLFAAFRVPKHCEHKILFWGVFGALVMRAAMIFAGVALINRFHWLIYVFGAFLVLTGLKMLRPNLKPADPEKHWVIRLCRRLFRVTDRYHDDRFVIRDNGKLWATPLLARAADGRDLRFDLRGRFDPGDSGGVGRPVHRLHVQRLRDARPASVVLRTGGHDGQVPVLELWVGGDLGVRRCEDDAGRCRPDPGGREPHRGRGNPRRCDDRVAAASGIDNGSGIARGRERSRAGSLSRCARTIQLQPGAANMRISLDRVT